jgi:hypothetical protein
VHSGFFYNGSSHLIGEGLAHLGLSARGKNRGGILPHRRPRLAGKIQPTSGTWSAVEWPGSKPATRGGAGFRGRKRQCSPESGCPRRHNPSGGEQWWWRGEAVEAARGMVGEHRRVEAEVTVVAARLGNGWRLLALVTPLWWI